MAFKAKKPDGDEFEKQLAALAQAMGAAGQAGSGQSSYPGQVYMGPETRMVYGGQKTGEGIGLPRYKKTSGWVSGEEAESAYNSWTPKKREDFLAQLKIAGLADPDAGIIEAGRLWRELVKEASYFGVKKAQKISPWDILSGYVNGRGGAGAVWAKDPSNPDFEVNRLTGERRYVGPRFKTTTQKSLNFSDPATAAAIATRAFQDLMGRDPGKGELGAFADALHNAESKSPIVTTTTTEFDPTTGEAIGADSTSSGGMDAAGKAYMAEQRVKGTKEYGVVQATTTYQNVLENLIWGAPQLGGD